MNNYMKTVLSGLQQWVLTQFNKNKPDWSQNNRDAGNYVKNRTHWEEYKEIVLIDNLTSEEYANGDFPLCTFILNQKYDVTWNGVLYKDLICHDNDDCKCIAYDDGSTSFYIDDDGGNGLYVECDDETFVLSIATVQNVVHKLDERFIPDSITRNIQLNEMSNTVSSNRDSINSIHERLDDIADVADNANITAANNTTNINASVKLACSPENFRTDNNTLTGVTSMGLAYRDLIIPRKINGYSITSIGDRFLYNKSGAVNIIIPDSVTNLGIQTFENCGTLRTIELPNAITSIPDSMCDGTGLKHINIPDSVTSIGSDAFRYCNMEYINIPNSVTNIGVGAFQYCKVLKTIALPRGLTIIESKVFDGCWNLASVTIPNTITSIKEAAFGDCPNLTTVYYDGTEEEWNAITIASSNESLLDATKVFNYGTPIQKLPVVSLNDAGKSLKVSETGEWIVDDLVSDVLSALPMWEGGNY